MRPRAVEGCWLPGFHACARHAAEAEPGCSCPRLPCRGADVKIKNAEGKTAGEVAEMNEQAEVVELLKTATA